MNAYRSNVSILRTKGSLQETRWHSDIYFDLWNKRCYLCLTLYWTPFRRRLAHVFLQPCPICSLCVLYTSSKKNPNRAKYVVSSCSLDSGQCLSNIILKCLHSVIFFFCLSRSDLVEKNAMLRTKAMREKEEQRERRKYNYTLLRIRLPDGSLLQGRNLRTIRKAVTEQGKVL